jgi:protease I
MEGFMGLFGLGNKLRDKRVAILCTYGVEQIELTSPKKALEKAGAVVHVITPHSGIKRGKVKAWNMVKWGKDIKVDVDLSDARVGMYDALHLPGGVINPDLLRLDENAVKFVRDFFAAGKPVASICHGPWMLIEAGVVQGRRMTSWPSLRTDLRNAGAEWVDEEVVEDRGVVTSRGPQDLSAFNKQIVDLFSRAPMVLRAAA